MLTFSDSPGSLCGANMLAHTKLLVIFFNLMPPELKSGFPLIVMRLGCCVFVSREALFYTLVHTVMVMGTA